MKICVFSDSHRNADALIRAAELEKPQAVFFLGDGEEDFYALRERFPALSYYAVRGNCDMFSKLNASLCCDVGGVRIFAAHGHQHAVRYESAYDTLAAAARREHARVALFGHTHEPYCREHDGLLILNPGSAKFLFHPRYAVLEIEDGTVEAQLKEL